MSGSIVVGLFASADAAQAAARRVVDAGFAAERVEVLPPRAIRERRLFRAALVGMGLGCVLGLVAGGGLGYLATLGTSPLGSVTSGVGDAVPVAIFIVLGAAVGMTSGALFGVDSVGDPAMYVVQEVRQGRALVSVSVEPRQIGAAEGLLAGVGALDVLDLGRGEAAHRVTGAIERRAGERGAARAGRPQVT